MAAALDIKQLNELLECPVCFVVPTSGPLKTCKNGHMVCSSCEPNLTNGCPVCQQPIDTRALQLEKMVDMMTIGKYLLLKKVYP
jgi:predicted amidophosphoribosyltransferase